MSHVDVQDLVKHYGPVHAVDGLSFTVQHGSITGFLGPNGSGKTTTLRALLGLLTPTSGSATIDGRPYRALAEPMRRGRRDARGRRAPESHGTQPPAR